MKKFENFCNAYKNLKDIFDYEEPYSNVVSTGMIENEELWLSALIARNNVSHAYNKEIALDIIRKTKDSYYMMFGKLKKRIEEWI